MGMTQIVDPPSTHDPPHDREAEEHLLGYAMASLEAAKLVLQHVRGEWFYFEGHRAIFSVISQLVDKDHEISATDVNHALEHHPLKGRVWALLEAGESPLTMLADLCDFHALTPKLVPYRAARLKAAYKLRRAYEIGREIQYLATPDADPAAIIESASEQFRVLANGDASEMSKLAVNGPAFIKTEWPKPRPLLIDPFGDGIMSSGELAILHAASGLGKTFLAEQLAHAVATGEPFLNFRTPAGGAPVLIFQLEVSPYQLAKRRATRYINPPEHLWTLTADQLQRPINILEPGDLNELAALVKEKSIALLILDPLQELHDLPETNETFHQIVRSVRRLMMRTGAAVLLIHHEAKETPGNERQDRDAFRGGTRLPAGGKFQMRFKRTPSGQFVLTFAKVSYARTPPDVYLKPDDNGWWQAVDPPASLQRGDKTVVAVDKALDLAGSAGLSWADLESAVANAGGARSREGCRKALTRLAREAGLEGWQDLNIGTPQHPVLVHPSSRGSTGVQLSELNPDFEF